LTPAPQWIERIAGELLQEAQEGQWSKIPPEDLEPDVVRVKLTSPIVSGTAYEEGVGRS